MKDSTKESPHFGMNRTGTQLAPKMVQEMIEGYREFSPQPIDATITAADIREAYIHESEQLGSVPPAGTVKGVVKTGLLMLKGNQPQILMDKLGERLAYERSGTRLYDAFITKCHAIKPRMSLGVLEKFRNEEAQHFAWLRDCIVKLGADPTAQTPCADAVAVATLGFVQLVNDPRSTIPQCAEALLGIELLDNDGWELLIQLVDEAGLKEEVELFKMAKRHEENHLETIRHWVARLVLENESASIQ